MRKSILLMAAAVLLAVAFAGPAQAVLGTWDLLADWTAQRTAGPMPVPAVGIGPDGAWSYGRNSVIDYNNPTGPITFVAYVNYDANYNGWGVDAYDDTPNGNPMLENNTVDVPCLTPICVCWTAPRPMTVDVSGTLAFSYGGSGQAHNYYVRKNNDVAVISGLLDSSNPSDPLAARIAVAAGDVVYLYVLHVAGAGGNWVTVTNYKLMEEDPAAVTATPVIKPGTSSWTVNPTVSMTCSTVGSSIRYTTASGTDPSAAPDPTVTSPLYSAPFTIAVPAVVKAVGFTSGLTPSVVTTAVYSEFVGTRNWDMFLDFEANMPPAQGLGPDGVWSFGENTAWDTDNYLKPITFAPFVSYRPDTFLWNGGNSPTYYNDPAYTPLVCWNGSSIVMHTPGVCRWTAPRAFNVSVNGGYAGDGTTIQNHLVLRKNNETALFDHLLTTNEGWTTFSPTNYTVSVEPGDVIDLYGLYVPNPPTSNWGNFMSMDLGISEIPGSERVPAPVLTPPGGDYTVRQTVTMSCAAGAVIHYTTDGSPPTTASPVYSVPISVGIYTPTTVKAYCVKSGWTDSTVVTAVYSKLATPRVWDSTADFASNVLPPTGIGPDGVWSYGVGSGYNSADPQPTITSFALYNAWQPMTEWGMGSTITYRLSSLGIPPVLWNNAGTVQTHTPNRSVMKASVIRWTANRSITVDLSGHASATTEGSWDETHTTYTPGTRPCQLYVLKNDTGAALISRHFGVNEGEGGDEPFIPVMGVEVQTGDVIDMVMGVASDGVSEYGTFVMPQLVISEEPGTEKLAPPTLTPPGGAYTVPQSVSMTHAEPTAILRYTTDGSAPTGASPAYSAPMMIEIDPATTIKAKTYLTVGASTLESDVVTQVYSKAGPQSWDFIADYVAGKMPPVGIGSEGAWSYGFNDGAHLDVPLWPFTFITAPVWDDNFWNQNNGGAYCVNSGAAPFLRKQNSDGAVIFHSPVLLQWTAKRSFEVDIVAQMTENWWNTSDPTQRQNHIILRKNNEVPALDSADITDPTDLSRAVQAFSVHVEPGDNIYLYVAPFANNWGHFFTLGSYQIGERAGTEQVGAPSMTPGGGIYLTGQTVAITCSTYGATIRYTTDGTDPTSGSPIAPASISVSSAMTVKAKAFKSGMNDSFITAATYQFTTAKTLAEIKGIANDLLVGVQGVVTTATFGSDIFYVETADRSIGIQCRKTNSGVVVGKPVELAGTMKTDTTTGERYINVSSVRQTSPDTVLVPALGINGRGVGGGAFALQTGFPGRSGLNNVGLLVLAWGKLTSLGGTRYQVDDGSGPITFQTLNPLVYYNPPENPTPIPLPDGSVVQVYGISSSEISGVQVPFIRATGVHVILNPAL